MITIRIRNPVDLIRQEKGWIASKLAGVTGQAEARVEAVVAEEIRRVLSERGVEAEVSAGADS